MGQEVVLPGLDFSPSVLDLFDKPRTLLSVLRPIRVHPTEARGDEGLHPHVSMFRKLGTPDGQDLILALYKVLAGCVLYRGRCIR